MVIQQDFDDLMVGKITMQEYLEKQRIPEFSPTYSILEIKQMRNGLMGQVRDKQNGIDKPIGNYYPKNPEKYIMGCDPYKEKFSETNSLSSKITWIKNHDKAKYYGAKQHMLLIDEVGKMEVTPTPPKWAEQYQYAILFPKARRSGLTAVKSMIDIFQQSGNLLFTENYKPKNNTMKQDEFAQLVSVSNSVKELATSYIKKDYSNEIVDKKKELAVLKSNLKFYKELNTISGQNQLEFECKQEEESIKKHNAEIQAKIDKLEPMLKRLADIKLPVYEKELKIKLGNLEANILSELATLDNELKDTVVDVGDVYCWLCKRIDEKEQKIYSTEMELERLTDLQENNKHLLDILKKNL